MFNICEDDLTNSNLLTLNYTRSGKIACAIRQLFNWYCHIQNKEYNLPYNDGYINYIHADKNWIKFDGLISGNEYRWNIPIPYRNEMNIPTKWLFQENWKELIEQQIKRDKNEYLIKKLSE